MINSPGTKSSDVRAGSALRFAGYVLTDVENVSRRVAENVYLDEVVTGHRYRQRARRAVHHRCIDYRLVLVEQHQRQFGRWIGDREQHVLISGEADAELVGNVAAVSQRTCSACTGNREVSTQAHRVRQHLRLCKTVIAHECCIGIVHVGIHCARRQDLNAPAQRERAAGRTDVDRRDARSADAAVVGDGEP